MEVGAYKIAEDGDFQHLKDMVDDKQDWLLEYDKTDVKVWTKQTNDSTFKIVKVLCNFPRVNPGDLYDVIHDPDYRKVWDHSMIEAVDIGHLNPNNDVSYYAVSCPSPMKNRDFVLQRSWLDMGDEQYIINHSVFHKNFPEKRDYVRAVSIFTGYLIKQTPGNGCKLGYVTQSNLQGDLPQWLVNKCTQMFAPKYVRQLEKAAIGYRAWKNSHNPHIKPWHFPEQITSPKLAICSVLPEPVRQRSEVQSPVISKPPSVSFAEITRKSPNSSKRGSINEPASPPRKIHLLSCMNFTKRCLGKNHRDPALS